MRKKAGHESKIKTMYINDRGEMYLQFFTDIKDDLKLLFVGTGFSAKLQSGYQISGKISRITKSGVAICNWRLS